MDDELLPVPDHVRDAVLKALKSRKFSTYLDPLSALDKDHAQRLLAGLTALATLQSDAGGNDGPPARGVDEIRAAERAMSDRLSGTTGDYALGVLHGKLSALRWALGGDWDTADR